MPRKLTTEEFIKKAIKVHGNRYDYSEVKYILAQRKVIIICKIHGEFKQTPNHHLNGCGCPKCAGKEKLTKEIFKERANKVHNNKYDYSKVEYKNIDTKVIITCCEHGDFLQTPYHHLEGNRCPKCANIAQGDKKRLTKEEFIKKSTKVHGNRYDYSKVRYVGDKTNVIIICSIHGDFLQTPNSHKRGGGCPKCAGNIKLTKEKFIKKSIKIHGDKYDYSKVKYIGAKTKVTIICKIHGEFRQAPTEHLSGSGCSKCAGVKKLTEEEFIKKSIKIHGHMFDYSKVKYVNGRTNVIITCRIHGDFLQTPCNHFKGQGCPRCLNKSEGEVGIILKQKFKGWNITPHKKIWNRYRYYHHRRFCDFWLEKDNVKIMVEYDGMQHFQPVRFYGTSIKKAQYLFKKTKLKDKLDAMFCREHGIILHRIRYDEDKKESIKKLVEKISK